MSEPAGQTHYFPIKLGGGLPSSTGVFLPDGYVPGNHADVILYLGGIDMGGSVEPYWKTDKYPLRQQVNASSKNVILVAPTLGLGGRPGARFSAAGTLEGGAPKKEDADAPAVGYLKEVLRLTRKRLVEEKPVEPFSRVWAQPQCPALRSVVLACHSGGGYPFIRIAKQLTGETGICECWAFDCMYFGGDLGDWALLAGSGVPLYVYALNVNGQGGNTTLLYSRELQRKVSDPKTGKPKPPAFQLIEVKGAIGLHYYLPAKYLKERIDAAKCLEVRK